jgi:hypothetical protein
MRKTPPTCPNSVTSSHPQIANIGNTIPTATASFPRTNSPFDLHSQKAGIGETSQTPYQKAESATAGKTCAGVCPVRTRARRSVVIIGSQKISTMSKAPAINRVPALTGRVTRKSASLNGAQLKRTFNKVKNSTTDGRINAIEETPIKRESKSGAGVPNQPSTEPRRIR